MSFASLNGVNAAKGIGGTARATTATFNQSAAAPLQGQPQGMGSPGLQAQAAAPIGSSYTQGAGMGMTGRYANAAGAASQLAQPNLTDQHGVNPGVQGKMANVGAMPAPMSAADMQDPENAALAGYAFSATQDRPASASTNPRPQPVPQARPQQAAPAPGQTAEAYRPGPMLGAAQAASTTLKANNPISAAIGPPRPGPQIMNRQVM